MVLRKSYSDIENITDFVDPSEFHVTYNRSAEKPPENIRLLVLRNEKPFYTPCGYRFMLGTARPDCYPGFDPELQKMILQATPPGISTDFVVRNRRYSFDIFANMLDNDNFTLSTSDYVVSVDRIPKALFLSPPVTIEYAAVLVHPLNEIYQIQPTAPFQTNVWLCVLVSALLCSLFLIFVNRLLNPPCEDVSTEKLGLQKHAIQFLRKCINSIYFLFNYAFDFHFAQRNRPRLISAYESVIVTAWCLAMFSFLTFYRKSFLRSNMASSGNLFRSQFESRAAIARTLELNPEYHILASRKTSGYYKWFVRHYGVAKALTPSQIVIRKSYPELINHLLTVPGAILLKKESALYHIFIKHLNKLHFSNLKDSSMFFASQYVARHHHNLRYLYENQLAHITETGLLNRLKVYYRFEPTNELRKIIQTAGVTLKPTTIGSIQSTNICYAVAIVVSLIVFGFEIYHNRHKQRDIIASSRQQSWISKFMEEFEMY